MNIKQIAVKKSKAQDKVSENQRGVLAVTRK